MYVSRFHAILYVEKVEHVKPGMVQGLHVDAYSGCPVEKEWYVALENQYFVVDQGSSHGTHVNKQRLNGEKARCDLVQNDGLGCGYAETVEAFG